MPENESLPLPSECDDDIHAIQNSVRNRAERYPIPSTGYITDFPSVYGCESLASRVISNASQKSAATLDSDIKTYSWKILLFFPGRPTIGRTFTAVIPIASIGALTVRIEKRTGEMDSLELPGYYHLFHNESTLIIEGVGRLAALVIVPNGC